MGIGLRRLAASAMLIVALAAPLPVMAAPPKIGQVAPDFHLKLLDGSQVSLADLRGQVVVLNFWATWCAPCKRELPLLDAYFGIHKKHGLQVFAVTTEDSVPLARLKPLAAALNIPMVRHLSGNYAPMGGVPTNYVIDRAGVLRYAKASAFDLDDLNSILIPLLNEPSPPDLPAPVTGR